MDLTIAKFFAAVLALAGPAPKDAPTDLILRSGDKIVAIGDSATASGGYLRDIDAVLAQQYPDLKLAPIINKGASGQRADQLSGRVLREIVEAKPAVILINVGVADVFQKLGRPHDPKDLERFSDDVTTMVERAQEAKIAHVVLIAPTLIEEDADSEGNRRLKLYVDAMRKVAAEKKTDFVDAHAMILGALAKAKGATRPGGAAVEVGEYTHPTFDGVHLTPVGTAIMAVGVLRAMGVPDDKIAASQPPVGRLTFEAATRPATATATTKALSH